MCWKKHSGGKIGLMKKFSFYSSIDIERKWSIWKMSGKIREILIAFKPFLGILNGRESYGSLRLERRIVLKCTCKNSNERPGLTLR
jgi:hypothetical protein